MFVLFSQQNSEWSVAKSYRAQLLWFSIKDGVFLFLFFIALKFSWTAASEGRVRRRSSTAINIGSPIPSSLERQRKRHKQERTAVFMGKWVEKPLLALICPK